MTKDQESGGAPLEQLPDEALCRLIREQDRPAEEVLAARYHRVVRSCARPYFLAGGLTCDTVGEAVKRYSPYGVDVSSGIETGGWKDRKKMTEFVRAVRSAAEGKM